MPPAVLLLLRLSSLLQLLYSALAFPSNETDGNTPCTSARCGDLSITYPFTLSGVQPRKCGFPAFELACDGARAYLTRSFRERLYRVYNISYDNHSLVVAVDDTFSGGMTCGVPDFNVSSGLALYPLNISSTNKNLTLLYNCLIPHEKQLFPPCVNHSIGAYVSESREGQGKPPQWVPWNCSSVVVPVRAFNGTEEMARNYTRLINEGFLLEWPAQDSRNCDACRQRGGECRFVKFSFRCHTSRGNETQRSPVLRPATTALSRDFSPHGAGESMETWAGITRCRGATPSLPRKSGWRLVAT